MLLNIHICYILPIYFSNKKPINGIDCFFSEESFNKYSGIPSTLEERLLMRIRQMKGEPVCPSVTHRQNETASDARLMNNSMLSCTNLGHNLIKKYCNLNEMEKIIQACYKR